MAENLALAIAVPVSWFYGHITSAGNAASCVGKHCKTVCRYLGKNNGYCPSRRLSRARESSSFTWHTAAYRHCAHSRRKDTWGFRTWDPLVHPLLTVAMDLPGFQNHGTQDPIFYIAHKSVTDSKNVLWGEFGSSLSCPGDLGLRIWSLYACIALLWVPQVKQL